MTTDLIWTNVEVSFSSDLGNICGKTWELSIVVFVHQEQWVAMVVQDLVSKL